MSTAALMNLDPIKVFPDSGHHLTFIPLLAADRATEDAVHERLGLNDQVSHFDDKLRKRLREIGKTTGVVDAQLRPSPAWIRSWFGTQQRLIHGQRAGQADLKANLIGLWIAIESNIGSRTRGYITRESCPADQDEITAYNSHPKDTPYAYETLANVDEHSGSFAALLPVGTAQDGLLPLCSFSVVWLKPDGEPIDVDLIVDFGNTRSAILALEHLACSPSLAPLCKPIPFLATDAEFKGYQEFLFDESLVLADSWFVLRQPPFEGFETISQEIPDWHFATEVRSAGVWPFRRNTVERRLEKVTYRIPHMFVQMSPAVIGPSARLELLRVDLSHGANYFLSSPKRYAWDTDLADGPGAQNWHMLPNSRTRPRATEIISGLPNLACQMLRFMVADGSDWSISDPPTVWPPQQRPPWNPNRPRYPRSDTLAWTALTILENAYQIVNSNAWRKDNRPFGARRLRDIVVTFPSGWTAGCFASAER